jgi:FlaA1/EpsC-like NDP-sugar epimerase
MKQYGNFDIWLERACHMTVVGLSAAGAFLLRFDCRLPASAVPLLKQAVLIAIAVKLPIFDVMGFYRSLRRFVSIPDLYLIFLGNLAGSVVFAAVAMFLIGGGMPRSVLVIDAVLCFLATALVRFSVRICNETFRERSPHERTGILIYGAGRAGAQLVREIQANRCTRYEVKGFVDDDPLKQGARVLGFPVLGSGRQALAVVRRLNRRKQTVGEIIIAIPSATGLQLQEFLANCRATGIPCKTVPGIEELLSGKVLSPQVRNPSADGLLGRPQVHLDETPVQRSIAGRSILITGAAGSIGSELCRQVARFRPACLVALDQAESDLFRIENELRDRYPTLELVTALGNIREADRLAEVLQQHRVDSIFHAAAYKHVPMMESQVVEALRNNILGTWNLVGAAIAERVRNLVMISSDKAVNPVCIMGATKRVCERIVSARWPGDQHTKFVSVRFGNVLGSNGSVIPIFQAQIAAGGPIKVTHPEARRYFMSISEAVSLALQASIRSEEGEIFVLDMGEPIRIVDLAENMIRLAGKIPYVDINIQFTGLRPGEKLIEALKNTNEGLMATSIPKLNFIREQPLPGERVDRWIEKLKGLMATRNKVEIVAHLRRLVPEYHPKTNQTEQPSKTALAESNGFHCELPLELVQAHLRKND